MDEPLAACFASAARKITKIRFVCLLSTMANVAISGVSEEDRRNPARMPTARRHLTSFNLQNPPILPNKALC
jgi:hypothetical protein